MEMNSAIPAVENFDIPKPRPGNEAVVCFTTQLPEQYKIPEDHMVIPASLGRYGLSEVVNRLLSMEQPTPFDFIVRGDFLRTSLAEYLENQKLTSEAVLCLEYVFAMSDPQKSDIDEMPDWVSGIAVSSSNWFTASSYDGTVRVYNDMQSRLTVKLTQAALKAVAVVCAEDGSRSCIATACKDGSVRCCGLQHNVNEEGSTSVVAGPVTAIRSAQTRKSVETVAFNDDGSLLASGGWDNDVLIWNADPEMFELPQEESVGTKRKATFNGDGVTPKFVLGGHSQAVTCVRFGARAQCPYTLLSGSWDSSVRVWDIVAAGCVCNWSVSRAVTSFSMSPMNPPCMVTSHEDGHVSFWDIRAPPHPSLAGAVGMDSGTALQARSAQIPHRRLAAQVMWCPHDANRIASVGYDGHLCILDPRSPKMPVQDIRCGDPGPSPTSLLCIGWLSHDALVAGGSDGKVQHIKLATQGDNKG